MACAGDGASLQHRCSLLRHLSGRLNSLGLSLVQDRDRDIEEAGVQLAYAGQVSRQEPAEGQLREEEDSGDVRTERNLLDRLHHHGDEVLPLCLTHVRKSFCEVWNEEAIELVSDVGSV